MEDHPELIDVDLAELNEEEFQEWLQKKYPGRTVKRDGDNIAVNIPVNFYRRNGRQTIKAKKQLDGKQQTDSDVNDSLVTAIAKAYAWQEEYESGEYGTIEELAKAKGVDRSYAGRVLRLTSLSPQIVEAILAGDESHGLSLRQLQKGVPLLWSEQQRL